MTQPEDVVDMPAEQAQAAAAFETYNEAFGTGKAPLLGYLVLYSVYDGDVTQDQLTQWFTELQLDPFFCPPPVRPVDAYEKVTGPDGLRYSYILPLTDPAGVIAAGGKKTRAPGRGVVVRQATLMIRSVRRDGGEIVRHLVREERDADQNRLAYEPCLGAAIFRRDNDIDQAGAGDLQVEPVPAAINKLPNDERKVVRHMLDHIAAEYRRRCDYISGDRLRALVRTYVESLNPIRVRPSGGVYFVHARHAEVLAGLRELVPRFGGESHFFRVPLPDADEMREMVIQAFTNKAADDLNRLSTDIVSAQHARADENTTRKLYERFAQLQAATNEHATLLSTTLDDTQAALQLVKVQLGSLLTSVGSDV